MKISIIKKHIAGVEQISPLFYLFKWFTLALLIGILAGSAFAFFWVSLDWATHWGKINLWIIALLPLIRLNVGLPHHYLGIYTSQIIGSPKHLYYHK